MPIQITKAKITKVKCDAVVAPTNAFLKPSGGIGGAIYARAGEDLEKARNALGEIEVGQAKITPAFNFPSKYVIHTACPNWQGGGFKERELLRSCYVNSLKVAVENGCESVAIPLITLGDGEYLKDRVIGETVSVINEFLQTEELNVYLVAYDVTAYELRKSLQERILRHLRRNYKQEDPSIMSLKKPTFDGYDEEKDLSHSGSFDLCYSAPYGGTSKSEGLYGWLDDDEQDFSKIEKLLKNLDKTFAVTLLKLIDLKGMTDVECYKKANVDRKTFNKLKNNPKQKPSKQTAVAFAIALKLNFDETQHLHQTTNTESTLTFHKWGYFLCFCYKFHFYFMINLTKIVGASCARPQI